MAKNSFRIEWDAHEYEHKVRTEDWYWAVTIITVGIAIAAIIFGNIIFGILIIISAFALSLFINRPPDTIHIVVDEKGIIKEKIRYPYSTLHSFWIDVEHPHKKILLRSQKTFMPLIIIPLGDEVDPDKLQRTLIRVLPEEYYALPFTETILEYLGF
ncbi:MAG: hypothetical protein M3Q24_01610 [bacterium]|nr:hypothetical protein [bacterium]